MSTFSQSIPRSRRTTAVLFLAGVLAGFIGSGSAIAAPSTTVTWKVSSLAPRQVINLSAVVSTNSSGIKTWSKTGSCTLMPSNKPTKLTMGTSGSCVLTLKIAKSKSYPAKSSKKTITLLAPTSSTTATVPMTTTTAKPTTNTTVAPSTSAATITTSGIAYTPTSVRISVGQSVAFDVSSSHDVKWQDGSAGRGATGAPYSRTFSNAGTYSFFCSIHTEMTGTITVG